MYGFIYMTFQKSQNRNQISGCQGLDVGKGKITKKGYKGTFWDDEILVINSGHNYMTYICQTYQKLQI